MGVTRGSMPNYRGSSGPRQTLRGEGTAHDFIRDFDIKFGLAVDAGDVLAFLLSESTASGNVDVLPDFTVRAFDRHLVGCYSGDAIQGVRTLGSGEHTIAKRNQGSRIRICQAWSFARRCTFRFSLFWPRPLSMAQSENLASVDGLGSIAESASKMGQNVNFENTLCK